MYENVDSYGTILMEYTMIESYNVLCCHEPNLGQAQLFDNALINLYRGRAAHQHGITRALEDINTRTEVITQNYR